jgi:uncharacterized membrane protein
VAQARARSGIFGLARGHLRARPRFYISFGIGLGVALLMPGEVSSALRLVIGWDCVALVFLALLVEMASRATHESMRYRASLEDPARWVFLALMAGAGLFSMFAIFGVLREAKSSGGSTSAVLTALAGATILLSWLLAHSIFAVHYAHDYFNDLTQKRQHGLDFPGEHDDPDYWDFLYFSFVIGMTAQVSDVQVLTKKWRRLVLAHGILSFLFNTVILALSINLIAGFF